MLKKIYRLSSIKLYNSKRVNSTSFDIKVAKNNLGSVRFGFVISKKLDKRAVVRNSVKRKLSKSIEEIFDRIENGYDFVFYPRPRIVEIKQDMLNKEIENVLKKEGLLNV